MKRSILLTVASIILLSSNGYAFMSDAFIGEVPNRLEAGATSLMDSAYLCYERSLTNESSVSIFYKSLPREAGVLLLNYRPDYTELTSISYNKQLYGFKPNNLPVPFIALAASGGLFSGTYIDTSKNYDTYVNKSSLELGLEASIRGILFIVPSKMTLGMYYADTGTYSKYTFSFSVFSGIEFLLSEWSRTVATGSIDNLQFQSTTYYVLSGFLIRF